MSEAAVLTKAVTQGAEATILAMTDAVEGVRVAVESTGHTLTVE